jgi:alginate O-acetyltransferase complex protein AlgJ
VFSGFGAVLWRGGDALVSVLRASTTDDLTNGSTAQRIDKAVFNAMPRSSALDGLIAGLQYRVLHDAGPQVYAGCGNWLFSQEELRTAKSDSANLDARVELLRRLVQAVASLQVQLIILPVPDKAAQVEDELCGLRAAQSHRRDAFWTKLAEVKAAGLVDIRPGWPKPGYWQTDTHWNQVGARFAAAQVAGKINSAIGPGSDKVQLIEGTSRQRIGDLTRLAGLSEAPVMLAPAAEQERETRAEIARSGGLLDEAESPSVILAGSSFSLNSNFHDYLEAALSREVVQVSEAGGGFAGALLRLLGNNKDAIVKAKVVIWEWPMRTLTGPLTAEERRFLGPSHLAAR